MTLQYLAREYERLMEEQAKEIELSRMKIKQKYKARIDKIKKAAKTMDYYR